MANYASRKERARRKRAQIRRRITATAIIMLIIGIALGYLLNTFLHTGKIGYVEVMENPILATSTPKVAVTASPAVTPTAAPTPTATPIPTAVPTEAPTAQPVVIYVEVTPVPTEVPTAVPTEVPTEVPTVVPTEAPTEVPTVAPTATPEPTEVPTEAPTAVPTEAPTMVPTVAPTAEIQAIEIVEATEAPEAVQEAEPVIIPFGHSQTFETQVSADGKSRRTSTEGDFETLNLTLTVSDYKDHDYYVDTYTGKYKSKGNEAALEFKMTLNDYEGVTAIYPQEILLITFRNSAGEEVQGYQITDAEIAGQVDVTLMSDVTTTMYKRYPYDAQQGDMEYMVVTTFNDGTETEYWFQMTDPVAEAAKAQAEAEEAARIEAESTMTVGSQGENVKKLQAKLIELNLLSGSPDGKFGKYTAEAVKVLQGRYGMEQTGITSVEFLEKLYE